MDTYLRSTSLTLTTSSQCATITLYDQWQCGILIIYRTGEEFSVTTGLLDVCQMRRSRKTSGDLWKAINGLERVETCDLYK